MASRLRHSDFGNGGALVQNFKIWFFKIASRLNSISAHPIGKKSPPGLDFHSAIFFAGGFFGTKTPRLAS